jgi:predicted outer membrane repeat protein
MATITVTTTADGGKGSLRAAIASAQSGDIIRFASTLANKTLTLTKGQIDISVGKNLTIDGADAASLTISGNKASRIFFLNSTSATPTRLTVRNLTLANGYTSDRGGAISTTHQSGLIVSNVSFKNNVADLGGGAIFSAFEGTLTVTHSKFTGNRAIAGNDERGAGAIAFWGPRNCTIRNSEFTGNQGINGGAINSLNGKLTIENSRFVNNTTLAATYDTGQSNPTLRGYGGAIYTDRASASTEASGSIRISGSTFIGNKGRGEGGAAYLYTGTQDSVSIQSSLFKNNRVFNLAQGNDGNGGAMVVISNGLNRGLTIANTTFANNIANNQGGGLWMMDAPTNITNSTFSGNKTLGTDYNRVGGGMTLYGPTTILNSTIAYNHAGWVGGGVSADNSNVTVKNTIFYQNTADNGTNDWGIEQHTNRELTDLGGNIQWTPKQTTNWNDYNATASIQLIDPKLGALKDNGGGILTHALLSNSPAINAGVDSGAPNFDQRGTRRQGITDVGAYEFLTGAFTLVGSSGADILNGSTGVDHLKGNKGNDLLLSLSGDDVLNGGDGTDLLDGGTGSDRLMGGNGNDILIGGFGQDVMLGGNGKDRLIYNNTKELGDIGREFETSRDVIDLSKIVNGSNFRSSTPFSDYIQLRQSGIKTIVSVDIAGDRTNQFRPVITLEEVTANSLSAKNFLL